MFYTHPGLPLLTRSTFLNSLSTCFLCASHPFHVFCSFHHILTLSCLPLFHPCYFSSSSFSNFQTSSSVFVCSWEHVCCLCMMLCPSQETPNSTECCLHALLAPMAVTIKERRVLLLSQEMGPSFRLHSRPKGALDSAVTSYHHLVTSYTRNSLNCEHSLITTTHCYRCCKA